MPKNNRSKRTTILLVLFALFANRHAYGVPILQTPIEAQKSCIQLLSEDPDGVGIEARLKYLDFYRSHKHNITSANDKLMKDLVERSNNLKLDLKLGKTSPEYDFIFIGAGIHTAIVVASIKQSLPNARILILERQPESVSVFGATGATFFGNTLESDLPGTIHTTSADDFYVSQLRLASRNVMPGAPIQTSDLAFGKVPKASEFAAPVISIYHHYKPDILFGINVDQIIPQSDEISVPISDLGISVTGKIAGAGVGLGQGNQPSAINSEAKHLINDGAHVVFIETFLAAAQAGVTDTIKAREVRDRVIGKDIIFLGGAHGSAIGIDFVLGLAPVETYGGLDPKSFRPKSITWVGLKDKNGRTVTGDVFKQIIGGGDRYHHLAALIDDGTIKVVSENASISTGNQRPAAVVAKNWRQESDLVIYAIGYNQTALNGLLSQLVKSDQFQTSDIKANINPIDTRLKTDNVTVGRRIIGSTIPFFLYGPAAGGLAEPSDPGGAHSPVININASRSFALGKTMVNTLENIKRNHH